MIRKAYVAVDAHFYLDGNIKPLRIYWEDGRVFEVDRILDQRRAASIKAGGVGIRYTCRILGNQTCVYYDEFEHRWFVEAKK